MSNITFIKPNMIRITTALSSAVIRDVKEVAPELLQVVNEKDEVIFRVDTARSASVSSFGVAFVETDNQLVAAVEFDIQKPTSKFIAANIKKHVDLIELAVEQFISELADIEIETI